MRRILKGFSILLLGVVLIMTSSAGTYAGFDQEVMAAKTAEPQNPSISIKLQRDEISYKPGESIEYSIIVKNTGDVELKGLKLNDLLQGEKSIEELKVGEELIFKEAYAIPLDIKEEFIANKVTVAAEVDGAKVEASDSFKAYMERMSSIEYTPEDGREEKSDGTVEETIGSGSTEGEDGLIIEDGEDTSEEITETEGELPLDENGLQLEENALQEIEPMNIVPGGLEYYADTEVLPLKMNSINDNTEALFTWIYQGDIYLAIISHDYITSVTYNGVSVPVNASTVERAVGRNDFLKIHGPDGTIDLGKLDPYAKKAHNHHRWSVVKISGQTLTSPFIITVITNLGGGHDLIGITVHIDSDLQVFHQYDGGEPILDVEQSGSLKSDFSYSVYPVYEMDGLLYRLVRIERVYNGDTQPDKGPEDLVDGKLTDTVPTKTVGGKLTASAKITFIYELVDDGEITVTKVLQDGKLGDESRKFDIFITGPEGKLYVLTLKPGESKTITGLKYGTYTIRETVPMNFKMIKITASSIELDKDNKEGSSTITNKRTNDGWFYDDDEKENKFTVGIRDS